MSGNQKKKHASKLAYSSSYDYNAQKIKHLERQVKKQPNNQQVVDALAEAKKGGKKQMNRSQKKGGWIDKNTAPWDSLSHAVQQLPGGGVAVNQFDLIMNSGLVKKKRFARFSKQIRHAVHRYDVEKKKEDKKAA